MKSGFIVLALIGLFGCAQSESTGTTKKKSELVGDIYAKGCEKLQGGSGYNQKIAVDTTTSPGAFTSIGESYYQSDCSGAAYIETKGTGTVTVLDLDAHGYTKTDVAMANLIFTVHDQAVVDYFNGENYCGFSDWAVGVPKDVTGHECSGYTVNPQTYYTITHRTDTTMQLGKSTQDHLGDTPATRHVELDETVFTKTN